MGLEPTTLLANRAAQCGRGAWAGALRSLLGPMWPAPVGACGPCARACKARGSTTSSKGRSARSRISGGRSDARREPPVAASPLGFLPELARPWHAGRSGRAPGRAIGRACETQHGRRRGSEACDIKPAFPGGPNSANPWRGAPVAFTRAATEGCDRQEIHDATTGGSDGGLR